MMSGKLYKIEITVLSLENIASRKDVTLNQFALIITYLHYISEKYQQRGMR